MKKIIFASIFLIALTGCTFNNSKISKPNNELVPEAQQVQTNKDIVKTEQKKDIKANQNSDIKTIQNKDAIANTEDIKNAFYRKNPKGSYLASDIYIKKATEKHAMGSRKSNNPNLTIYWYATKIDSDWIITDYNISYFGTCQNFKKYNFPADMIPDCWDEEKMVVMETPNFDKFFKGLKKSDREEIQQAYIKYRDNSSIYQTHKVFVKIDKYGKNYLIGTPIIEGSENRGSLYILAVRIDNGWKILFVGQDNPPCETIKGYNVPLEAIKKCWDYGKEIDRT